MHGDYGAGGYLVVGTCRAQPTLEEMQLAFVLLNAMLSSSLPPAPF